MAGFATVGKPLGRVWHDDESGKRERRMRLVTMGTATAMAAAFAGAAPVQGATPAAQASLVFARASELERAELACGPRASLSEADKLVLLTARNNAQAALDPESFATLGGTAASAAVTAAAQPGFCARTLARKRGALAAVRRAGASLGRVRR